MPCFQPRIAHQTTSGEISLRIHEPNATHQIAIACQQCLGCRATYARNWALRGQLELQDHETSAVTTLTYDDDHVPNTLSKKTLQAYLKRLRTNLAPTRIRFLASGEYGERTNRPHYHAILYGAHPAVHGRAIQEAWGLGHVHTEHVTPAAIAYVAGYTAKKINFADKPRYKLVPEGTPDATQRVNPNTGEVYFTITVYQPPFLEMSRGGKGGHGIGGNAKQWPDMWRDYAIHNGHKIPVPRYLHEAWEQQAHPFDIEEQQYQKYKQIKQKTQQELQAAETILRKQQQLKTERKTL